MSLLITAKAEGFFLQKQNMFFSQIHKTDLDTECTDLEDTAQAYWSQYKSMQVEKSTKVS